MALKGLVRKVIGQAIRSYGYELVDRSALYDWQQPDYALRSLDRGPLPEGAAQYLDDRNPKLKDLIARYSRFNASVTAPLVWTNDLVSGDHLRWFRGDHAYVWQLRGPNMNQLGYTLTTYYAKAIDTLRLLDRLTDDGLFGNITFEIDGRTVSRDLLDSIVEIYFLERHLGISALPNLRLLDIGAGYGRLAHRAVQGLSNVAEYLCVDAVAASTFISDYYLRFRKCDRATVVPLDEIDEVLARGRPAIAINVHSFSECRLSAVDWWLALLQKHQVRHLMIVPNAGRDHGGRSLATNDGRDFAPLVERHGYKLLAREAKYRDPAVQDLGINPTWYYLFELT
jgi:hypothetical protein